MSEELRSCRVIQSIFQRDGGAWAVDNETTDVIDGLYGKKNIVKLNNLPLITLQAKCSGQVLQMKENTLIWQHCLHVEAS